MQTKHTVFGNLLKPTGFFAAMPKKPIFSSQPYLKFYRLNQKIGGELI